MGGFVRLCAALSVGIALVAAQARAAPGAEDHAARAKLLEDLGKTAAAAREYEAAFAETRKPELLYHLAICWRTLGVYKQAREALRGYLREAPDGPLASEVERQLAQIAVLIEARGLQAPPAAAAHQKPAKPRQEPSRAIGGPAVPPPEVAAPAPAKPPEPNGAPAPAAPIAAAPPPAQPSAIAPATPTTFVSDQHQVSAPSAPPLAVQAAPEPAAPRARTAPILLAGGAVLAGAAGAVLCVGAHEISSDLDAKFTAGTLTQADLPRYSKSRAEGIAGTALIGAAVLALGAAAVLAW